MKHLICLSLIAFMFASCTGKKTSLSSSSTTLDSVSYALGIYQASRAPEWLNRMEIEPNYDQMIEGMKDALLRRDTVTKLDWQWAEKVISTYLTERVKEKSRLFLDNNKKNDSVKVLESGLQYKVISEGTGISPRVTDTINVKYRGTTTNGQLFDERVEPIKMPLNQMIQGWKEGIPMMKEGAKYVFYVPSDLAYGDMGRLAGEALIYEVELIDVIPGAE